MNEDIFFIDDRTVQCSGSHDINENLNEGHPTVFLTIKAGENQILCPYCGRRFVSKTP